MTVSCKPELREPAPEIDPLAHEVIGAGRLDLLVGSGLVVELKAVEALLQVHMAQVLAYLRITGHVLALLINFNVPMLRDGVKRIVSTGNK